MRPTKCKPFLRKFNPNEKLKILILSILLNNCLTKRDTKLIHRKDKRNFSKTFVSIETKVSVERSKNLPDLNHRRNQRGRINRREIRVISLPVGLLHGQRDGERERERGLVKRCKNVIYRFRSACDERQCVPAGG